MCVGWKTWIEERRAEDMVREGDFSHMMYSLQEDAFSQRSLFSCGDAFWEHLVVVVYTQDGSF